MLVRADYAPGRGPEGTGNCSSCYATLSSPQMDNGRMQLPSFARAVLIELSWWAFARARARRRPGSSMPVRQCSGGLPVHRAIGRKIEVPGIRAAAGHESRVTVGWLRLDCAGHAPGAGAAGPSTPRIPAAPARRRLTRSRRAAAAAPVLAALTIRASISLCNSDCTVGYSRLDLEALTT